MMMMIFFLKKLEKAQPMVISSKISLLIHLEELKPPKISSMARTSASSSELRI